MINNNFLQFDNIRYLNLIMKRAKIIKKFNRKKQFHLKHILHHKQRINLLTGYLSMEKTVNRTIWTHKRTKSFWEKDVPLMNDYIFKENFRMSRSTFSILCEKLVMLKREDSFFRKAIPLDKKIAIAVYALASAAEYRCIANLFGVGRTTVGEIVIKFCEAVWTTLKSQHMNFFEPLTSAKLKDNIDGFNKLGFPQCFGAIDGCHIQVKPPVSEGYDFYNFKGWYSTILLAVVDYRYRFIYINVGAPGRIRDCYLYEISALKKIIEESSLFQEHLKEIDGCCVQPFLIGDSAFALSKLLMKPYTFCSTLTPEQTYFNKKLSTARRVVENAFGHLKARFRKIGKGLELHIENINTVIKAACVLHNFLNDYNDKINQAWIDEMTFSEAAIRRQYPDQFTDRVEGDGDKIRNVIAESLFQTQEIGVGVAQDSVCVVAEALDCSVAGHSDSLDVLDIPDVDGIGIS